MIHRIMLAAALLTVPAIVMAEPPAAPSAHAQQADSAKAKKHGKKALHRKSGKTAVTKPAPSDSGK